MTITAEGGIEQLEQEFAAAKIEPNEPGFYEDRAFIRREAQVPHYLDNYARYVQWRHYDMGYAEHAEPVIHVVAEEIQMALKADGSPEAHAEAPLAISRILEREGIWNYVACGAMTINFPPSSSFDPFSFWSINMQYGKPFDCAYRWVVAPPFQIVDVSIQACRYPYPFNHLLPKIVWATETEATQGTLEEIFSPDALKEIKRLGLSDDDALDTYLPNYRKRFAPDFPAHVVTNLDTQLKYTPTRIMISEESLEQLKGFQTRGLSAAQLYSKNIRPRLP
jgi:hypothetical protein